MIPLFLRLDPHYREDKSTLIAIFNSLAAYYTRSARLLPLLPAERAKKQNLFQQATLLLNKADNIDAREEITWVGKGLSLLFRGPSEQYDRVLKHFQTVLDQNPNNLPALLGRACVLFHQGQYDQACAVYKKVQAVMDGMIGRMNSRHRSDSRIRLLLQDQWSE